MDYSIEQEFKKIYRQLKCKANCNYNGLTFDNGLTRTANNIQLGGEILQTTEVYFDGGTNQLTGLWFLPEGFQNFPIDNTAVAVGMYVDPNDLTNFNGFVSVLATGGIEGSVIGNSKATGEFVKLANGDGQIDLEVNSSDGTISTALKLSPLLLTFGDYVGGNDLGLIVDIELGFYTLGANGAIGNGTKLYIDDNAQTIEITNVPSYANNAAAFAAIGANKLYYTDVAGEYILKLSH